MSAEKAARDNTDAPLFSGLVALFASSVMQHLGKTIDPSTGKAQVNMDAAQMHIDILDMLAAKTLGNLSKAEDKFLKDTLTSLKLNYAETSETLKTQAASGAGAAAGKEPAPPQPAGPDNAGKTDAQNNA